VTRGASGAQRHHSRGSRLSIGLGFSAATRRPPKSRCPLTSLVRPSVREVFAQRLERCSQRLERSSRGEVFAHFHEGSRSAARGSTSSPATSATAASRLSWTASRLSRIASAPTASRLSRTASARTVSVRIASWRSWLRFSGPRKRCLSAWSASQRRGEGEPCLRRAALRRAQSRWLAWDCGPAFRTCRSAAFPLSFRALLCRPCRKPVFHNDAPPGPSLSPSATSGRMVVRLP
jgi:hypothetical protein